MTDYVCSVDLGTSWIKCALFDRKGTPLVWRSLPVPDPETRQGLLGWDVDAYCAVAETAMREVVDAANGTKTPWTVKALALSTQRASVLGLDASGKPLTPLYCWHDPVTEKDAGQLPSTCSPDTFRETTGMPPLFVLSIFKIMRLAKVDAALSKRVVRYSFLHDFFLKRWGAEHYVVDPSNASASGMVDIRTRTWSRTLMQQACVREDGLPDILDAGTVVGTMTSDVCKRIGMPQGVALVVGGGDQQCAALAMGAVEIGRASLCLGTGGFLSCAVEAPQTDKNSKLYCLPHVVPGQWVLEGMLRSVGSAFEWMLAVLGDSSLDRFDQLAGDSEPGARGVSFFPFLCGCDDPRAASDLLAGFDGLSISSDRADMVRAVVEGVCFALWRLLDQAGDVVEIEHLTLSGNVCNSALLLEIMASLVPAGLSLSKELELSLLGAGVCAWSGLGAYSSLIEGAASMVRGHEHLAAAAGTSGYELLYDGYLQKLERRIQHDPGYTGGAIASGLTGALAPTDGHLCELLRRSVALAGVAFYCYRLDGTITAIDKASVHILDLDEKYPDPDELVGTPLADLIVYVNEPGLLRDMILKKGFAKDYIYHFKTLSGKDRWTLHDSYVAKDPVTGEEIIHAMVRDVSEHHRTQQALQASYERLRQFGRRMSQIREQERGRLAAVLHDGVAQLLCGLQLQVTNLSATFRERSLEYVSERLSAMDVSLSDMTKLTNSLIRELRPSTLDDLGLSAAIEADLRELTARASLKSTYSMEGAEDCLPTGEMATDLFRVYQEAIRNVERHASATRAAVRLKVDATMTVLQISDNGCGISEDAPVDLHAFGIMEMRERVLAWRGRVTFGKVEPTGTMVTVELPRETRVASSE